MVDIITSIIMATTIIIDPLPIHHRLDDDLMVVSTPATDDLMVLDI